MHAFKTMSCMEKLSRKNDRIGLSRKVLEGFRQQRRGREHKNLRGGFYHHVRERGMRWTPTCTVVRIQTSRFFSIASLTSMC